MVFWLGLVLVRAFLVLLSGYGNEHNGGLPSVVLPQGIQGEMACEIDHIAIRRRHIRELGSLVERITPDSPQARG
jgi:hypothetical protein